MKLKAVLFDLDGVLVKSKEAWFRTAEEAGRVYRGRPVTREEFDPTFGQGTGADVEVFKLDTTEDELNRFYIQQFPRFATDVWVNPEADALLTELTKRGLKRAVVTNCTTPVAEVLLKGATIRHHVNVLSCADEAPSKPEPDLIHLACKKLGISAIEALMVGDSRFDHAAATTAGARFVGFGLESNSPRITNLLGLLPLL